MEKQGLCGTKGKCSPTTTWPLLPGAHALLRHTLRGGGVGWVGTWSGRDGCCSRGAVPTQAERRQQHHAARVYMNHSTTAVQLLLMDVNLGGRPPAPSTAPMGEVPRPRKRTLAVLTEAAADWRRRGAWSPAWLGQAVARNAPRISPSMRWSEALERCVSEEVQSSLVDGQADDGVVQLRQYGHQDGVGPEGW